MSLLNKWVTMKSEFAKGGGPQRRPYLATECDDLRQAERWRLDVIKEVSKGIGEIQNAGLGEHRIRDLNDQINKLLREKFHWQKRIRELGGPDYNAIEPRSFDADGRELPGGGGYKYFGAAKELPGVRELFQAEAPQRPRRTRAQIYKTITPDYYGYRDEDDEDLLRKEALAEKEAIEEADAQHQRLKRQRREIREKNGENPDDTEDSDEGEDDAAAMAAAAHSNFGEAMARASAASSTVAKAHVPVPSQDEVKQAILDHRKQQLLQQLGVAPSSDGGNEEKS